MNKESEDITTYLFIHPQTEPQQIQPCRYAQHEASVSEILNF